MGKYSDIVKSKNESGLPENQKTTNTDNKKTIKVENQKNRKTENQEDVNTDSQKTEKAENQKTIKEDMVNLSIKVPKRLRQKWVAESRLRGTTLTAIITDYLKTELGE